MYWANYYWLLYFICKLRGIERHSILGLTDQKLDKFVSVAITNSYREVIKLRVHGHLVYCISHL